MKVWRVVATDTATWRGTGEEYQDRWQAEEKYEEARKPGVIVTLAEFQDNRMVEIIRSSQFEQEKETQ